MPLAAVGTHHRHRGRRDVIDALVHILQECKVRCEQTLDDVTDQHGLGAAQFLGNVESGHGGDEHH